MLISLMDGSLVWSNQHHQSATPRPSGALPTIIASQRVGARRRPMTGSAKQSSFGATIRKLSAGTDEFTMGLRSERGALPSPRARSAWRGGGGGGGGVRHL